MGNTKTAISDSLTRLVDKMPADGVQTILGVFAKETQEFKLDLERKKFLKEELHLKDVDLNSWQTAADVIRHFDASELAVKHPQAAKNTLIMVLSMFPPTLIVAGLCAGVPEETLSNILGFSLKATPDHLINMLVTHQANVVAARNAAFAEADRIEDGKRNLAFVTKDELLFQQLKKLVETDDDEAEVVIGTKDGTVRLVRWEEQKWLYRSRTDTVDTKVLVIGDCKGADSGVKLMNAIYDQYGIRYGWIGNCAYVHADLRRIRAKGVYDAFLRELREMPAPEIIKEDKKLRLNWKTGLKTALATPLMAKDLYDDTVAVKRQMYFFGVIHFYYHGLEEFLES
ncbi:MAG: hypothetical protein IKD54_04755 [Clostridia bacterium]|nr:hypothetical protein [Clostridia bacterium]MBR3130514.1 hypothetical protein [Clostridia bacterium]